SIHYYINTFVIFHLANVANTQFLCVTLFLDNVSLGSWQTLAQIYKFFVFKAELLEFAYQKPRIADDHIYFVHNFLKTQAPLLHRRCHLLWFWKVHPYFPECIRQRRYNFRGQTVAAFVFHQTARTFLITFRATAKYARRL